MFTSPLPYLRSQTAFYTDVLRMQTIQVGGQHLPAAAAAAAAAVASYAHHACTRTCSEMCACTQSKPNGTHVPQQHVHARAGVCLQ